MAYELIFSNLSYFVTRSLLKLDYTLHSCILFWAEVNIQMHKRKKNALPALLFKKQTYGEYAHFQVACMK